MDALIVAREVPASVVGSCGEVRDRRFGVLENHQAVGGSAP
jgi:hypothetical protein